MRWSVCSALLLFPVLSFAQLLETPRSSRAPLPWEQQYRFNLQDPLVRTSLLINVDASRSANLDSWRGPAAGSTGLTPDMVKTAYNLPQTGGSGAIAIVDAFHYPTALADFNAFARKFGLPTEAGTNVTSSSNKLFQIVYASGKQPSVDASWALESALDVQWAHAMAPKAKIYLVEAATSGMRDMLKAVEVAKSLPVVRQISLSWGSSEFAGQAGFDSVFTGNAQFYAASGDTGGIKMYPAASPGVVAVGGTRLSFTSQGQLSAETGWSGSGGGISSFSTAPKWQAALKQSKRCIPDLSAVADPASGALVYTTTPYNGYSGWLVVGGTSWSAPLVAGIANLSGRSLNVPNLMTKLYTTNQAGIRDITVGTAGANQAKKGYDLITGLGSPLGSSIF